MSTPPSASGALISFALVLAGWRLVHIATDQFEGWDGHKRNPWAALRSEVVAVVVFGVAAALWLRMLS